MAITNVSTVHDKHTQDMRSAIEHRATWFQMLLDATEDAGAPWEEIGRKAISRCGVFHGGSKFTGTDDLEVFAGEFANELAKKIFEMDILECAAERFVVEFHYCPLVNAWMKHTDDGDRISKLCDIAMDGDRGIVSEFPKFDLDLQETIAEGGKVCRIVITKNDK